MKWSEIRVKPSTIKRVPKGCTGVHESILRSYQILEKVKDYLKRGVPADVILELIEEAEEYKITEIHEEIE